jgi:hypothetical protein
MEMSTKMHGLHRIVPEEIARHRDSTPVDFPDRDPDDEEIARLVRGRSKLAGF